MAKISRTISERGVLILTTNDIINGVSIKLNELFNENYAIYTNDMKQGLENPCFLIKILKNIKKRLISNRYENELNLVIQTMLDDRQDKSEILNDILDKLYGLEYITLSNKDILQGRNMKSEISDGILLFMVTYHFFTYEEAKREETMQEIIIDKEVKE